MRKALSTAGLILALAGGSAAFSGTAMAATPVPSVDNCISYTLKIVNGKWTLVPSTTNSCQSTSTGTNGTGSTGTGTSTQGTTTNNCPLGGCTSSATGTAGRSR